MSHYSRTVNPRINGSFSCSSKHCLGSRNSSSYFLSFFLFSPDASDRHYYLLLFITMPCALTARPSCRHCLKMLILSPPVLSLLHHLICTQSGMHSAPLQRRKTGEWWQSFYSADNEAISHSKFYLLRVIATKLGRAFWAFFFFSGGLSVCKCEPCCKPRDIDRIVYVCVQKGIFSIIIIVNWN